MEEEIHFIVNELEEKLQGRIKDILAEIEAPKAQKDNLIIKKFTRALVQATARRLYPRQRQERRDDTFARLDEYGLMPFEEEHVPQPFYKKEIPSPQISSKPRHELSRTLPPPSIKPSDGFFPSGLPPKPSMPLQQKLPTEETLSYTPESFKSYLPSLPQGIVPEQPIAVKVPEGVDPPLALIIDSETRKPIVTVTIKEGIYTVIEPPLTQEEISLVNKLRDKYKKKEKKLANKKKLNKRIWKISKKVRLKMNKNDPEEYTKMKYYLVKHLMQLGWVEPLLHDEKITKITCEGPNIPLTIIREGKTIKTNVTYPTTEHINRFIKKFAERAKKKITGHESGIDIKSSEYHLLGAFGTISTAPTFTLTKEP